MLQSGQHSVHAAPVPDAKGEFAGDATHDPQHRQRPGSNQLPSARATELAQKRCRVLIIININITVTINAITIVTMESTEDQFSLVQIAQSTFASSAVTPAGNNWVVLPGPVLELPVGHTGDSANASQPGVASQVEAAAAAHVDFELQLSLTEVPWCEELVNPAWHANPGTCAPYWLQLM